MKNYLGSVFYCALQGTWCAKLMCSNIQGQNKNAFTGLYILSIPQNPLFLITFLAHTTWLVSLWPLNDFMTKFYLNLDRFESFSLRLGKVYFYATAKRTGEFLCLLFVCEANH